MSGRREGLDRHDRDRLRAAILDEDGLSPLIRADPQRAAELLRAAVVDPLAQSRRGLSDDDGSLHITDAPRWLGAVPERGPFRLFLTLAPETAIGLIVEITEHATARWSESERHGSGFEVLLNGEPVELVGDAAVMHWNRGAGRVPTVLTSMLMALEAWFYRQLDEGNDVEPALGLLLASRSVALWGLAADLAAYRPKLLRGSLAPLISGAELLIANRSYRVIPHSHGLFAAFGDQAYGDRIVSWHAMEHRKVDLLDLVMRDVVSGVALVNELAVARARWAERDLEGLKHLIAQTDLANLHPTELGDGVVMWEYVPPGNVEREATESNQQMKATQLWLMSPHGFREKIDRGELADDGYLDALWALVGGPLAAEMPEDLALGGVRSRADVECGLAAVLVVCGHEWLEGNAEAQVWCRERLLAPFADPPPIHQFDDPGGYAGDSWDSFCADALPRLWMAAPNDIDLRSAIVRLAIHRHRTTVRRLMARVADLASLGAELRRLEFVSLVWARWLAFTHERNHRVEASEYWPDAPKVEDLPDIETPTREVLAAFEEGQLSDQPPGLSEWVASTPEGLIRVRDRRSRALSVLDADYLLAAFDHLLKLPPQLEPEDFERRVLLAEDLAALIAEGMQPEGDGRVHGTPYEHERIALERLGAVAVAMPLARAAPVWRPLLEPGVTAHYWVEAFLRAVWSTVLERPSEPGAALLGEMIAFAEQAPTWARGLGRRTDMSSALVGLDRLGGTATDETAAQILSAAKEPWVRWVSAELEDSWFAERVLRFLRTAAAGPVLEPVLVRLAALEPRRVVGHDNGYDKSLGDMLAGVMGRTPDRFTAPDETGNALRTLLLRLAERGSPLALELVNRLS